MQTLAKEYISIPNGLVLTSSMTNYSRNDTTAIEVDISIGYDVPWRDVHTAMKEAAAKVDGVCAEPEPFILQKSLDDYNVSYRLFAFVDNAKRRPFISSNLNERIRDVFDEKRIKILSPAFTEVGAVLKGSTVDDIVQAMGKR